MQFWLAAKGCFLKMSWDLQRDFETCISQEPLLAEARSAVKCLLCTVQRKQLDHQLFCGKNLEKILQKGIAEDGEKGLRKCRIWAAV